MGVDDCSEKALVLIELQPKVSRRPILHAKRGFFNGGRKIIILM